MIKREAYQTEQEYKSALETYNQIVGKNKNKIIAISGPKNGLKVSQFAVEAIKDKMQNYEK